MKIHFWSTAFPWELRVQFPAIYAKGVEYRTYQHGGVRRAFGVSFGSNRFIGFIIAGPFAISEERIPPHTPPTRAEG